MARLVDSLLRPRARTVGEKSQTVIQQSWADAPEERVDGGAFLSMTTAGYAGNGVVFAVLGARLALFSEATPRILDLKTGRLAPPDERTRLLEEPWPNGCAGDLLARMEQDASLSGNSFVARVNDHRLLRLRPDRVEIVTVPGDAGAKDVIGYLYSPKGIVGPDSIVFGPEDVAHYTPIPDPLAEHRGMSWMSPIVREINADIAMTSHRIAFFENSATPNLLIKYQQKLSETTLANLRARFEARHQGPEKAWKTAVLDEGADLTVVGHSMEQMTFASLQQAGSARIAAAGGVPGPVIGIDSGDYDKAMKRFADATLRPLWRTAAAALTKFIDIGPGERLVLDASDVAALQDGEQERAETFRVQAVTAGELIRSGYDPETVAESIQLYDLSVLEHTGGVPTALYPEGQAPGAEGAPEKMPAKDSPLVQGYKGDGKSG